MINFNTDTWHQLRKYVETELGKARAKNDAVGLSEAETAALRGEIRFMKRFLDLPQAAAREVVASPDE